MRKKINSKTLANYLALLYGLLFALALGSCNKDEPLPNNPCKGAAPYKADFKMSTSLSGPDILISENGAVDTFYSGIKNEGASITFQSLDGDSVKWTIGNDPRLFTTPSVYLRFPPSEGEINVRMIGYGRPYKRCFPNDDGIDTTYKKFYLKNGESPFVGNFQGALASRTNDTFTVYLTAFPGNFYGDKDYFLYNFPKGNKGWIIGQTEPSLAGQGIRLYLTGKYFAFGGNYGLTNNNNPNEYASSELSRGTINGDTLTITLAFSPTRSDTFKGIRK
jgi:hypothetical protein